MTSKKRGRRHGDDGTKDGSEKTSPTGTTHTDAVSDYYSSIRTFVLDTQRLAKLISQVRSGTKAAEQAFNDYAMEWAMSLALLHADDYISSHKIPDPPDLWDAITQTAGYVVINNFIYLDEFNDKNVDIKRIIKLMDFMVRYYVRLILRRTLMDSHPTQLSGPAFMLRAAEHRNASNANFVVSKEPPHSDQEVRKPSIDEAHLDYEEQIQAARSLSHLLRRRIVEQLAPAMNAKIQGMPQGTLEEKKAICEFVNGELEPLGLAVKCPNTSLPAKLKATSGNWPDIGRFHFEVYIDRERKKTAFSDALPLLELMDAHEPKEMDSHFQKMVGPKSSRKGRKLS
jgi:hypothetical protein